MSSSEAKKSGTFWFTPQEIILSFIMGLIIGVALGAVLHDGSKGDMQCEVKTTNGDITRFEVCTGKEYVP